MYKTKFITKTAILMLLSILSPLTKDKTRKMSSFTFFKVIQSENIYLVDVRRLGK
jgi:hypothetical protein